MRYIVYVCEKVSKGVLGATRREVGDNPCAVKVSKSPERANDISELTKSQRPLRVIQILAFTIKITYTSLLTSSKCIRINETKIASLFR